MYFTRYQYTDVLNRYTYTYITYKMIKLLISVESLKMIHNETECKKSIDLSMNMRNVIQKSQILDIVL